MDILKNITKITQDDKKVCVKSLKIVNYISKYSSTKTPINHLILNGTNVKRSDSYRFTYVCLTCHEKSEVSSIRMIRKINESCMSYCGKCVNINCISKRDNHSQFMLDNMKQILKGNYVSKHTKKEITKQELIEQAKFAFNNATEEFKDKYYNTHLTLCEFDRIKNKIISLHNGKIDWRNSIEYIPVFKSNNQMKFSPIFYDKEADEFIKPSYITFKCEHCNETFTNRDLYISKGKHKIMCLDCSFCNRTFKLRNTRTYDDRPIQYQSKLEYKLIQFCNKHQMYIENGPKIPYWFHNSKHIYKVDFFIPKLKLLIETKDNHIWHKRQVESGKWDAKVTAVHKLIEEKIYNKYDIVYPSDFETYVGNLITMYRE